MPPEVPTSVVPSPSPTRVASPGRSRRRVPVASLIIWGLVAALVVFNAVWIGRRFRREMVPPADPQSIQILREQARVAERAPGNGRADAAAIRRRLVRMLEGQLRRSPHDGEAHETLARILAEQGDWLRSAEHLHAVPYWWPTKRVCQFMEGRNYFVLGRARDAEAAWTACMAEDRLHPTPPEYYSQAAQQLIQLYAQEARWDDARKVIWAAYDHAAPAEYGDILIMRMRLELEHLSDDARAVALRKYVKADPQDWQARRALALVEQKLRNDAEADALIQACLRARPDDPGVWRDYLTLLKDRGDVAGLAQAVARMPDSALSEPDVWAIKGWLLQHQKEPDWKGAAAALEKAISLRSNDPDYYYHLATSEQRLGQTEKAREHRARSQAMHEAYGALAQAVQVYRDLSNQSNPDPAKLARAVNHLAELCTTLGWKRAARAWARLAPWQSPV